MPIEVWFLAHVKPSAPDARDWRWRAAGVLQHSSHFQGTPSAAALADTLARPFEPPTLGAEPAKPVCGGGRA